MKKQSLTLDAKKLVLSAFHSGKLTKEMLKEMDFEEVGILLNNPYSLICVQMGSIINYSFNGTSISEEEYNRLSEVCDCLGIERISALSKWAIEVIPSDIPLASNEDEIKM